MGIGTILAEPGLFYVASFSAKPVNFPFSLITTVAAFRADRTSRKQSANLGFSPISAKRHSAKKANVRTLRRVFLPLYLPALASVALCCSSNSVYRAI